MSRATAAGRPRVLILIATRILGGPGKNLLQFLNRTDGDLDYVLATFARRGRGTAEFVRVARAQGIASVRLEEAFLFDPRTLWQAARQVRRRRLNLVQSHGYKSHLLALVISRLFGIPWVAYAHGWTREDFKARLYNRLDRWLLRQADTVVAVSPALQRELQPLRGKRPTELVLNAVDPLEIRVQRGGEVIRRELGVSSDEVLLGAVGRLSSEKGQEVLLRAFAQTLSHFSSTHLVLVGDGPEKGALRRLAQALGAAERIHFVGHQEAPGDFYQAMDLLVLPSYSEGLPNAVLEAMALGTPVLATRVGGVEEIISHGQNGWLIAPGSERELFEQLQKRLAQPGQLTPMGRRARASLYPKFDPQRRVEQIREIYAQLLAQRERTIGEEL